MKEHGFTLIELLVVVTIVAILAVALGFQFQGWIQRNNVESQIKTMQSDLMTARQRAIEKNIPYVVQLPALPAQSYTICEDTNQNNVCDAPAETTSSPISQSVSKSGLRYPITWSVPGGTGGQIVITQRGLLETATGAGGPLVDIDNTAPPFILLLNPDTTLPYGITATNSKNEVDYDCISLSTTRIDLGKSDGTNCVAK